MTFAPGDTLNRRVLRSRGHRELTFALVLVVAVITVGGIVSALRVESPKGSVPLVVAGLALQGIILLSVGVRSALSGVFIEETGVRVLNPFRTYRLPWSTIERFSLGPGTRHPSIGKVELEGGRQVTAMGIRGNVGFLLNDTSAAQKMIDELNAELARRRSYV